MAAWNILETAGKYWGKKNSWSQTTYALCQG